jgi:hypothetical protein
MLPGPLGLSMPLGPLEPLMPLGPLRALRPLRPLRPLGPLGPPLCAPAGLLVRSRPRTRQVGGWWLASSLDRHGGRLARSAQRGRVALLALRHVQPLLVLRRWLRGRWPS